MEPFLAQYPDIKYSYLIEIKYIKPSDSKKPKGSTKQLKDAVKEAETQLNRYSGDEKFIKTLGHTTLKKLVLVFSGNRLIHRSGN